MKRCMVLILMVLCVLICIVGIYAQVSENQPKLDVSGVLSNSIQNARKCGLQAVISRSSSTDNSINQHSLRVRVTSQGDGAGRFKEYRFLSVNLSKLPSGRAEDATTGQSYQSEFGWEEFISPSVLGEIAKTGSAEFMIDLQKIKWKDVLSAGLYYMPANEISPGDYFLYLRFEKHLGAKTETSCDIYSNELSISKDELTDAK